MLTLLNLRHPHGNFINAPKMCRHPKFIFKDLFFMFAILSPINFMENRKGSIVVQYKHTYPCHNLLA